MSSIQEIEQAILNLRPQELAILRDWFTTLDYGISDEHVDGVLEGIRQANNGNWVENRPDIDADMEAARLALETATRK